MSQTLPDTSEDRHCSYLEAKQVTLLRVDSPEAEDWDDDQLRKVWRRAQKQVEHD